ncbi:hypothetical protein DM02DRAFT_407693 [Periconia macrospinosa]|uniref:Uncharacterized protein n=1 Tax=Periconia macrospinosa TaxID=97972 RepID=A0A2V1E8B6_9PLEO|nr:hypothetical protein DM02DRAFT_407693 [Periconia macrospinosa]
MAPSRSSSHARLHKRGNSASSLTSPLSPVADQGLFTFSRSETPKVTYEEPWISATSPPMPAVSTSHPRKIKPYLRKLSSKDTNALDLSRPAEENEHLAGLGIVDYTTYTPSVVDVNFASVKNGRHRHTRSTSNTSQFSTSSSLQRPTAPYMPPARHTPRPYTPPMSKSTPASVLGSETEADDIMSDEEYRSRQQAFDPARRSGSISSTPGLPAPLRIHATGSTTGLTGSYSQSSTSLTSPIAQSRSRGDTLRSMETATSPSSRTSFDKAFGFVRPRDASTTDPAARAAHIRAARQAFQEKEEAKERKHEKEVHKQSERDLKKLNRKLEHQRRKSEGNESKRARSVSDLNNEKTPRPSIGGRQYSDHREPHSRTLPNYVPPSSSEKQGGFHLPKVTKSREAKGNWAKFVAWFKTRILRISRKMHG